MNASHPLFSEPLLIRLNWLSFSWL